VGGWEGGREGGREGRRAYLYIYPVVGRDGASKSGKESDDSKGDLEGLVLNRGGREGGEGGREGGRGRWMHGVQR